MEHKHKDKKLMLIRYGKMGHLGWFEHHESSVPRLPAKAVIKTDRGLELGEVVGGLIYKGGQFRFDNKEVEDYYGKGCQGCPVQRAGSFVRFGTKEDIMEAKHLETSAAEELETCKKFVAKLGLPMKLIDGEHLLGGERIVIYFSSNGRVDFRELVKMLAREYQTRIELRQVGSRDEARIMSDVETCGQPCCCRRFLQILEPVNMKMAKLQKATLDPSKISGHCGRLKCCLRYEDENYNELSKNLPRKNSVIDTPKGKGKVVDTQILTQLVVVQYDNGEQSAWTVGQLRGEDSVEEGVVKGGDDFEDGFSDYEVSGEGGEVDKKDAEGGKGAGGSSKPVEGGSKSDKEGKAGKSGSGGDSGKKDEKGSKGPRRRGGSKRGGRGRGKNKNRNKKNNKGQGSGNKKRGS